MAFLSDNVLDGGLDYLTANGARLDICSSQPANYAGVSSVSLGNKTSLSVGAAQDGVSSGRRVVVGAISDGSVTATGTASHFAITDGSAELLAAGPLASSQGVTNGNTFTLGAFSITIPDPA